MQARSRPPCRASFFRPGGWAASANIGASPGRLRTMVAPGKADQPRPAGQPAGSGAAQKSMICQKIDAVYDYHRKE